MDKSGKKIKKNYPMLGVKNWHMLREKVKKSRPEIFDADYVAKKLKMTKRSAANNVIPYLKAVGLIDPEGKPTELAKRWVDNKGYADVCSEIKDAIYPEQLISAVPDPEKNKAAVKKWFVENAEVGEGAAGRISAFYTMLANPEIKGRKPGKKTAKPSRKTTEKKDVPSIKVKTKPKLKTEIAARPSRKPGRPRKTQTKEPKTYDIAGTTFNVQIVLSKDTSPEQIDKVFESIAKHLKD